MRSSSSREKGSKMEHKPLLAEKSFASKEDNVLFPCFFLFETPLAFITHHPIPSLCHRLFCEVFLSHLATSEDLWLHAEQVQLTLETRVKGGQTERDANRSVLRERNVEEEGNDRGTRPMMEHYRLWIKKNNRHFPLSCSPSAGANSRLDRHTTLFFYNMKRGGMQVWSCMRCKRTCFMSWRWEFRCLSAKQASCIHYSSICGSWTEEKEDGVEGEDWKTGTQINSVPIRLSKPVRFPLWWGFSGRF